MDLIPAGAIPSADSTPAADSLSNELLWMIFERVPWCDRLRCRAVCQRWYGVLRGATLWKDIPRHGTTGYRLHHNLLAACREGDLVAACRHAE
jgi:hypothetical protein